MGIYIFIISDFLKDPNQNVVKINNEVTHKNLIIKLKNVPALSLNKFSIV